MKKTTSLLALILLPSLGHAALFINAGRDNQTLTGEGPTGADALYQGYGTTFETATTGQVENYPVTTFAEGGIAGTFNVGVGFSFPDATSDATKQAYGRNNVNSFADFFSDWVGIDSRTANGGIGLGTRYTLNLSGLPASSSFEFTSYHFDTQNQPSTFTVDQTPSASETATSPFDMPRGDQDATLTPAITNAYTFDVTSDASGNLDITYELASGTFSGVNGFDLIAVPEPSATTFLGLGLIGLIVRRRRS